jgi:hypothetical protein
MTCRTIDLPNTSLIGFSFYIYGIKKNKKNNNKQIHVCMMKQTNKKKFKIWFPLSSIYFSSNFL